MRPTLLNLETNEELRADSVLDGFATRRALEWRHVAGPTGRGSRAGFVRSGLQEVAITLTFESDHPGAATSDVREKLRPLRAMTEAGPSGRPPRVLLTWGSHALPAVIDGSEVQLGRCVPDGYPTRAVVRLRLTESLEGPIGPKSVAAFAKELPSSPLSRAIRTLGDAAIGAGVRAAVAEMREKAGRVTREVEAESRRVASAVGREVEGLARDVEREAGDLAREAGRRADGLIDEMRMIPEKAARAVEEFRGLAEGAVASLRDGARGLQAGLEALVQEKLAGAATVHAQVAAGLAELRERADALVGGAVADVDRAAADLKGRAGEIADGLAAGAREAAGAIERHADEGRARLDAAVSGLSRDAEALRAAWTGFVGRCRSLVAAWREEVGRLAKREGARIEGASEALAILEREIESLAGMALPEVDAALESLPELPSRVADEVVAPVRAAGGAVEAIGSPLGPLRPGAPVDLASRAVRAVEAHLDDARGVVGGIAAGGARGLAGAAGALHSPVRWP